MEIEHRLLNEDDKDRPSILLVINGYNELAFGFGNSDFALNRVLTRGKSVGVYTVITFDYLAPNLGKEILANNGAKVVFRPTTKQMARSSGIPESIKLESPDQAVLETLYEGKAKFTIDKIEIGKIYQEIFE